MALKKKTKAGRKYLGILEFKSGENV